MIDSDDAVSAYGGYPLDQLAPASSSPTAFGAGSEDYNLAASGKTSRQY
nr:hypothetical protein [Streptomyces atratus]